jgi:hypothetical protein
MNINNQYSQIPYLLIKKGTDGKVQPITPVQKISKYESNEPRRLNEPKKRNVETTAVILRISKQGKS